MKCNLMNIWLLFLADRVSETPIIYLLLIGGESITNITQLVDRLEITVKSALN